MENPSKEQIENWQKDPKNWVLYFFYYNPEDKRIFPPKRIGTGYGWTTNFANLKSIMVLVTFLLVVFGFIILIRNY
jgi:uncharacterized membrane protein